MTRFQEYSTLFKVFASNGKRSLLFKGVGKHLLLDKSRVWGVGIDPSTANTGIAIQTLDNCDGKTKLTFLLDITNGGLPNKEIYMLMLQDFLKLILEDVNVKLFLMEMPIANAKFIASRTKLTELKGFLNTLRYQIPALTNSAVLSVTPAGWRKYYLSDKKYKGRRAQTEDLKLAVMEEGLCRHPEFQDYADTSNKPRDSFDALGILEDGPKEFFWDGDLSVRRYHKGMYAGVSSFVADFGVVSMLEEDTEDFLITAFEEAASGTEIEDTDAFLEERGTAVYVVDTASEDINTQISAIVTQTNAVCLILFRYNKASSNITFMWAKEMKLGDNEAFYAIAWRNNKNNKADPDFQPYSYIEISDLFQNQVKDSEEWEDD